jgi:hypothetical protein
MKRETYLITITKVTDKLDVSYEGHPIWNGCGYSNFPTPPKVGQIWEVILNFQVDEGMTLVQDVE